MKGVNKMLSRKHYKMIASVINKRTLKEGNKNYLFKHLLVNDLCNYFASDNGLFNRNRFEDACND